MSSWQDITDVLTPQGISKLKLGQVLMFNYEGSETHLKIMRKTKGKVWAKEVKLYHPDEIEITDKEDK